MEENVLQTEVEIGKVETLKDRGCKLTIYTRELATEAKAKLFNFADTATWMVLAKSKQKEIFIPDAPVEFKGQKTQCQRTRATLYVLWDKLGRPGDSELFYRAETELFIEDVKRRIQELE